MWLKLRKIIFAGLLAIVPFVITLWILRAIFLFLDKLTAPLLRNFNIQIPGLGLILTLAIIFFLGLFVTNVIGRKLLHWSEKLVASIPLVSTIYNTIKQITTALSGATTRSFQQVIFIQYPRQGLWTMSFVTNESRNQEGREFYHVFVPTTPNPTSGIFTIVPKSDVVVAGLTVEEGLKAIISGGILDPGRKSLSNKLPGKD